MSCGSGQPLFGGVRCEGRGLSAEVRGRGHAWLRGKPFPKVRGSLGTQRGRPQGWGPRKAALSVVIPRKD